MSIDSMESGKKKLFLQNQGIKIMYPNKENVFKVPNHENNEDYPKNLSLSLLMDGL